MLCVRSDFSVAKVAQALGLKVMLILLRMELAPYLKGSIAALLSKKIVI